MDRQKSFEQKLSNDQRFHDVRVKSTGQMKAMKLVPNMGLMANAQNNNNLNSTYSSAADPQRQLKISAFNDTQEIRFEDDSQLRNMYGNESREVASILNSSGQVVTKSGKSFVTTPNMQVSQKNDHKSFKKFLLDD
jgi:hypothetical protein